jgi:hypothetical protein
MLSPGYVPSDMKDGRTNSFKIPLPDIYQTHLTFSHLFISKTPYTTYL